MSWEDIVKVKRESYMEQIKEEIDKIIEHLESEPEQVQLHGLTPFYAQAEMDLDNHIQLAIEMLKEINTEV